MPRTEALPDEVVDSIHKRACDGESLVALAKEHGRYTSNLSRLLSRRFGFVAEPKLFKTRTVSLPDDVAVLAYMAGIIDADGAICYRSDGCRLIQVGMTDEPAVRWLGQFGGRIVEYQPKAKNRKRMYQWQVSRQADVVLILEALLPYFIVKHARAVETLALLHSKEIERKTRRSN